MDRALFETGNKAKKEDFVLKSKWAKEQKRDKNVVCISLKYALYFTLMICCCLAKTGGIAPFSFGTFIALVYLKQNAVALSLLFVLSSLVVTGSFSQTVTVMICAVTVCATSVVYEKLKKNLPLWTILLIAFIGQAFGVYFVITGKENALRFTLEMVLSPLFAYLCVFAFSPLINKRERYRILTTSVACFVVYVSAVICGVVTLSFWSLKLYYVTLILCIGLSVKTFSKQSATLCALAFSLGSALANYDLRAVGFACFISVVFALFSDAPRPVSVTATLIGATGFALYFDYDYLNLTANLISLAVGGIIYCVLPLKALKTVSEFFAKKDDRAIRSLINGARATVSQEIMETGAIFLQMARSLRQTTVSVKAKEEELIKKLSLVCGDCNGCDRSAIKKLLDVTNEKGRATVNDVTELIRCDCAKVAQLISVADEEISALKKRAKANVERDERIEESIYQLESVSNILREKALIARAPLAYDPLRENALLDEFNYQGVPAVEVMASSPDAHRLTVVLAKSVSDDEKLAKIASKTLRSEYTVESVTGAMIDDYKLITLREKTAYDVLFATSAISKNAEAIGDTHSFIRISDSKFMMALCDGMGSGTQAGRISERAIDLVESFFRAGFDEEFVLKNVNKFLAMDEEESFVAFDVLVCDLNTLSRTIIKMGSPTTYVRQEDGVMKIEGSALPLGALGELRPFVSCGKAQENETVVFLSDGVTDAIEDERIAEIIATHTSVSLRLLCDEIIRVAKERDPAVSDDMTVVASRIIKRV